MTNTYGIDEGMLFVLHIRQALKKGVTHYNRAGVELPTLKSILQCLVDEGAVTVVTPRLPPGSI